MNEPLARSLFIDYLYNELRDEDKQKLEAYLNTHPGLMDELRELQKTRVLLQQMPDPKPVEKILMIEPKKRSFRQWWQEASSLLPQSRFGKTGFALAACLMLLLFIGSLTRLNISFTDAGTSVSLGYKPVINEGLSQQEAQVLLLQMQEEYDRLLSGYTRAMSEQNRDQLQQVVGFYEQQRFNDLQLIDQNLNQVQLTNRYQWQQTNLILDKVLQTANLQDQ